MADKLENEDRNLTLEQELKGLPGLATPAEVAKILRCTTRYIQEECRRGRMGHSIIAARYVMTPDDVREYIHRRKKTWDEKIVALPFNGARTARCGKSSGLKTGTADAVAQAQMIAEKLKKRSAHSCSKNRTRSRRGQVIQMTAR